MTDRIRKLTVVLDHDFRDDDVMVIVQAIELIRGVDHVKVGDAVGPLEHASREVAKMELRNELLALLHPTR